MEINSTIVEHFLKSLDYSQTIVHTNPTYATPYDSYMMFIKAVEKTFSEKQLQMIVQARDMGNTIESALSVDYVYNLAFTELMEIFKMRDKSSQPNNEQQNVSNKIENDTNYNENKIKDDHENIENNRVDVPPNITDIVNERNYQEISLNDITKLNISDGKCNQEYKLDNAQEIIPNNSDNINKEPALNNSENVNKEIIPNNSDNINKEPALNNSENV